MISARLILAVTVAVFLTGSAVAQTAPAPATPSPSAAAPGPFKPIAPAGDILSTLQASGEFNTFVKAATATNLTQILKAQPNITVLAPTDAAFAAMPAGELDSLMQPANVGKLQALVTYHLINARLESAQIKGHAATPVPTVANAPVTLDGSGTALKANDADIVQPDVLASNGVIMVIDKVLSPGWTAPPPGTAASSAVGG
jgi:uncharacterized surface protein with fasciclin (FAS1) repeats